MLKHKEQRVGVLVDVANMYHSAKNLYNKKVSFREILAQAVADRKLIRATAYAIRTENQEEAPFIEALEGQGFEVKIKDLQIFAGGAKKGDWDVGITIDAIKLANKLDVIIIVSGDGDYKMLIDFLIEESKLEKILFPNKKFRSSLYNQIGANYFACLDDKDVKRKIAHKPVNKKKAP